VGPFLHLLKTQVGIASLKGHKKCKSNIALGAQRKEVLEATLGRAVKLLALVQQQDCFSEF
jgi:hypothetical protein